MRRLLPVELRTLERSLRLLAILEAAEEVGLVPLKLPTLHMLAYFADVLAPVWGLPVVDPQILKLSRPYYPALQEDLDALVGAGVVRVEEVSHFKDENGWSLRALYRLNAEFSKPILERAVKGSLTREEVSFVNEVVFAVSGLDTAGIDEISSVDATYSDPLVSIGGLLEVDGEGDESATAKVTLRFRALLANRTTLVAPEMIHLYVRHLYSRFKVA